MSEATKYRREAEDCRRNAESALRPIDREAWLRLAADWTKLAEGVEFTQRLKMFHDGQAAPLDAQDAIDQWLRERCEKVST
jgi:hypothetical protein